MIGSLAATAVGAIVSGAVYFTLAGALWQRPGPRDARLPTRAFAWYWAMTGSYQVLVGFEHALAAADIVSLPLAVFVRYAGLALAALGVGGLMSFFAYLGVGRPAAIGVVGGLYVAVAALAILHVWRSEPIALATTPWSIDVSYARDFQSGLFLPIMAMLLLVPTLSAIWYATLARKTRDAAQRYRILAVGIGVALQLLSFLVARLIEAPVWELVSRTILSIVVAALVFSAHFVAPAATGRAAAAARERSHMHP